MEKPTTYDEAVKRAEEIITRLEQTEALSVDDYQKKANEVKLLLDFAEKCLVGESSTITH